MSSAYTTIALKPEEKEALDRVNKVSLDGNASYREVVDFLVEKHEEERQELDAVVLDALSRIDDRDVQRILQRRQNDANWVKEVADGD